MIVEAVSGLAVNLVSGARLALFLPVERNRFRIGPAQLVLFALVSALIDNAADWMRAEPGAVLDWAAFGAELASLAVLVIVAALLAWLTRDPPLLSALPVIVLASMPLVQVANLAPWWLSAYEIEPVWLQDTAWYLVFAWFVFVLARSAFVAMTPGRARLLRALAGGVLLATPLLLPQGWMPEDSWWSDPSAAPFDAADNPASELVIAFQRELQAQALETIEHHVPGAVDLYFVAFAPDGADADAGARVDEAIDAMDAQWRTEGRSLAYLNDYATLTETPMATVSHLREALNEIALLADPAEDVVMVYLTGRMNPDRSLAITLPPLALMQLTAPGLDYLLNEAAFRWRVIIVDACNSGEFAEALADPNTAVLAIDACARRGSSPMPDVSVFEALAATRSLSAGLESARRRFVSRGVSSTLHIGPGIKARLDRVRATEAGRARLGGRGVAARRTDRTG